MADYRFKLNLAGLQEIFKSSGMQAALSELADSKAAEANSRANEESGYVHEEPLYIPKVKVLRHTAIGAVDGDSLEARFHDAKYQTLNAINH